jgi:hypothetical protein
LAIPSLAIPSLTIPSAVIPSAVIASVVSSSLSLLHASLVLLASLLATREGPYLAGRGGDQVTARLPPHYLHTLSSLEFARAPSSPRSVFPHHHMPSISVTLPSSPVSYSQASKFYHLHRMSCSSWKPEHDNESVYSARFQCVNFDSEDLERYEPGGFHPVNLGDYYDDMRYKIVHKLGAGGFSTVWLARDEQEQKWVALKILLADKSVSVKAKSVSLQDTVQRDGKATVVVQHRHFMINGPNGLHLCLVLPVLGPSASQLSHGFDSRITPRLSRSTGYQITKALADLHAQGFCHGGTFYQ